jgi:hypothetical protein
LFLAWFNAETFAPRALGYFRMVHGWKYNMLSGSASAQLGERLETFLLLFSL